MLKHKLILMIILVVTMLVVGCNIASADVASGVYDGVDWRITDDYELIIGNGTEQTFANVSTRTYYSYPWDSYRSSLVSARFDGVVHGNGSMSRMFYECSALTTLDLTGFETSQVTEMFDMFYNCSKITLLDVSAFDTSNVTTMSGMFGGCSSVTTLDVSGFNTSNLVGAAGMFYKCSKLQFLDVSNWDVSNLKYGGAMYVSGGMFSQCYGLKTLDVSLWNTSSLEDMCYMFYGCSSLSVLDVSRFDTSNVVDMGSAFGGCSGLTALDVSNFNTSKVTDMGWMFSGDRNLLSVDVSNFDTTLVTDMASMFRNCAALVELDVSNFNTGNVTHMHGMFANCDRITSLDLSYFDTHSVIYMHEMFTGDKSLVSLDLSSFDTSSVTRMESMFTSCAKLNTVVLGEHNPFVGVDVSCPLLVPPASQSGVAYTMKWIRDDGSYGPYTPTELRDNYTSSMAGTWVWEKVPTEYTISFVSSELSTVGSMPPVKVVTCSSFVLPANLFHLIGYEFDHWVDDTGREYLDKATIPSNRYAVGDTVTLTAMFTPLDLSVNMQDGSFDFTLKADEKALFIPVPASTSYQVYEQTPFGWNLIKQVGNAGVIEPDEESEVLFLNKYDPLKATVRFAGTKLMDESVAEAETFSFLLYEDDILIDIATVGDAGVIEFQPITYDHAGVHNYTIQEVIGNDNSVEYDTHVESIVVTVESDGAGHLSVDISMDEDEILFENKSKPGLLALRKAGSDSTDELRDGTFYYEVQFVTQNGQPYELASSEISYEAREGNISEFPETQPQPVKSK